MKKLKYYIISFRLRTLPLSISGILLGSLLALSAGMFSLPTFLWALLTTLCLQILSNLANELGDQQKGTDNADRLGPIRSIQSGILTSSDFYKLIFLFIFLSLISGSFLIFSAFHTLFSYAGILMDFIGIAAILAAIKYTIGKNPYGYKGWGDIFVFLFFGLASTLGAYFLMTHHLCFSLLLPASAIGFLATGVLNVNNIRDIENDCKFHKCTIPVKIGIKKARIYHTFLIIAAQISMLIYTFMVYNHPKEFLFLLTSPLFFFHLHKMWICSGRELDNQLKYLSLSTLLFAFLSGIGHL